MRSKLERELMVLFGVPPQCGNGHGQNTGYNHNSHHHSTSKNLYPMKIHQNPNITSSISRKISPCCMDAAMKPPATNATPTFRIASDIYFRFSFSSNMLHFTLKRKNRQAKSTPKNSSNPGLVFFGIGCKLVRVGFDSTSTKIESQRIPYGIF